jgi:hypothetical protein
VPRAGFALDSAHGVGGRRAGDVSGRGAGHVASRVPISLDIGTGRIQVRSVYTKPSTPAFGRRYRHAMDLVIDGKNYRGPPNGQWPHSFFQSPLMPCNRDEWRPRVPSWGVGRPLVPACLRTEQEHSFSMPQQELASELLSREDTALLFGLTVTCPNKPGNPAECGLHEIRKLPIADRLQWAKSRTREEADAIFSFHSFCAKRHCEALLRSEVAEQTAQT